MVLSLKDIMNQHHYVVSDSSLFLPSDEVRYDMRRQFRDEIIRALSADHNLVSVAPVMDEISDSDDYRGGWDFYRFVKKGVQKIHTSLADMKLMFDYLFEDAKKLGVRNGFKKHPEADRMLASAAFFLARGRNSVAFASSDRRLNELVYSTSLSLQEGYPRGFPFRVKGDITTYSFAQRAGGFVNYACERDNMPFLQDRGEGQARDVA